MNGKRNVLILVLVAIFILGDRKVIADFVFGTPENLGPEINTSYGEACPCLSPDGLSLYFCDGWSIAPGGYGLQDIWMCTRATLDEPWERPTNIGPPINGANTEGFPNMSSDGLSLLFTSDRPGGSGGWDIWVATRETISDPWDEPVNLGPVVNSSYYEGSPFITADGLTLYFSSGWNDSHRPGGLSADMWMTTRPALDEPWGEPVNVGQPVNHEGGDYHASVSANGLVLFFSSGSTNSPRLGGVGSFDLWLARRVTTQSPWGEPVNLGRTVNSLAEDATPHISPDGSTLFYSSLRSDGYGDHDLWQVSISPLIDFSGDGTVDCTDICIMTEFWGTDDSLCDIAPPPFGDGVVDVQDLILLSEHLTSAADVSGPVDAGLVTP